MSQQQLLGADLGLQPHPHLPRLADQPFTLASGRRNGVAWYALVMQRALVGGDLSDYLNTVAPHGTPTPSYIQRAYELPDLPFPTILKGEHTEAPEGLGEQYLRFIHGARKTWMAALAGEAPGLTPVLAWQDAPGRRFLDDEDLAAILPEVGVHDPGVADSYLGRGLLFLANPEVGAALPDMMSLGGVTKLRPITGREFPLWVALPAHQPTLLAAPLLTMLEQRLTGIPSG